MTSSRTAPRLRRDADGRLATVGELLGVALAGLVCGIAVLLGVQAVLWLVRLSEFGDASGWLALVLPVWLFVEEFRAVGYGAARVLAGTAGAAVGVAVGMTLAGLVGPAVPSLLSGAVGAAGCTVAYCLVWFYGLRWLQRRTG